MPQYVLVDRPNILSKYKRSTINNGKTFSPRDSMQCICPYVPMQASKDKSSSKVPTALNSISLIEYQRTAQQNLITINNNLSNMLQETFSGIDNICQKVRLCLMEAETKNVPEISEQCTKCQMDPHHQSVFEDEVDSEATNNDVKSIEPDHDETLVDLLGEYDMDNNNDLDQCEAMIEETNQDTKDIKRSKNITPFFTVLNPDTQSAESVGVHLIKSITSQLGLAKKCTAENFQKSMKKVEKLSNYEKFLTSMVDDIDKEIEQCYLNCQKMGGDTKLNPINKLQDKRPKTSPSECRNSKHIGELVNVQEIKKFQHDFIEDHQSENDLLSRFDFKEKGGKNDLNELKMDFSYADVYRKRAMTDLHKRMQIQLEANDSLIFFQKLMDRTRRYMQKNRPRTATEALGEKQTESTALRSPLHYLYREKRPTTCLADMSKKYEDSLWFKQRKREAKHGKKLSKTKKKRDTKVEKTEICLPQSYTIQSSSKSKRNLSQRKLSRRPSEESTISCKDSCRCKVTVTNNLPLSKSAKCKMHWMRAKYFQMNHRKLKYLDILDDISKEDVAPLKAEYPRRDQLVQLTNVKDTYLYKLMYGKGYASAQAWNHLFDASMKGSQGRKQDCQFLIERAIKLPGENCDRCSNANLENGEENVPEEMTEKQYVIRTLSKYIFDPSHCPSPENNVLTVMPVSVHVLYDNLRTGTNNRRTDLSPQKLPLMPMKETKDGTKKAEWIKDIKKTRAMKVVYDPILRKIDKEIKTITARHKAKSDPTSNLATCSWSPRHFSQYCSPYRQSSPQRSSIKIEQQNKGSCRNLKCVATERTPPINELYKRSPDSIQNRNAASNSWTPDHDYVKNIKELEVKKKIQKDVEAHAAKLKSDQERKIWENKYGKSAGQKLLKYIEKQPAAYQVPIPKHALPKPIKDPTVKQEQMLNQLRNLKKKNNNIQTNIQKAIEVIENKMVDILGKPATTQSIEAFDEMEKEITSVLSMMKTPSSQEGSRKSHKMPRLDEYDNEVDKISDELFKKLDRILESPGILSSQRSSKLHLPKKEKPKKNKKQLPLNTVPNSEMNQMCFSSTSASGEEKFTITAISPKRSNKNKMIPPYVKSSDTENRTEEELNNISAEIKKLRNELTLKESSEEFMPPEASNIKDEPNDKVAVKETLPKLKNTKPIQKQVINVALIKTHPEISAGDQLKDLSKIHENGPDDITYSIGDGDSSKQSHIQNGHSQNSAETMKVTNIDEMQTDISNGKIELIEISDPYYTPRTSPLTGDRDGNTVQIIPMVTESQGTQESPRTSDIPTSSIEICDDICDKKDDVVFGSIENLNEEKNVFYENVHRIITRVENVYNQLEEFEDEPSSDPLSQETVPKVMVFQEPAKIVKPGADEFLTPFMQAVKEIRKPSTAAAESTKSSPRMYRSPSYFNVLTFLDTLTDFKEERAIEVHTSSLIHTAACWHVPTTVYYAKIEHPIILDNEEEIPKKKSGCLKDPSSHLNVTTILSKSRQKVSFLLKKEEKATQVTACPLHAKKKNGNTLVSGDASTQSSKIDEQVSAYMEVYESKSADAMSLTDDATYQSTFEATDEISSDKYQMTKQNHQSQNLENTEESKKHVVELFRNNGSEERKSESVKIFYDNYQKRQDQFQNKLIGGSYNEKSILRVKESLSRSLGTKKLLSVQNITKACSSEKFIIGLLKESSLFEPLQNVNNFIDSQLLKQVIEKRRQLRMLRRPSIAKIINEKQNLKHQEASNNFMELRENEGFLKGIYVFVYLLMFTALNLEYRCAQ